MEGIMKRMLFKSTLALFVFFLICCAVSAEPGFYPVLKTEEPAVCLDTDKSGNLYALIYNGEIIKIDNQNNTEKVYSGIDTGGFSWMQFTVLDDGTIIFSDQVDKKDAVFLLDKNGKKSELIRFDHEGGILSIASDKKSRAYIGVWESEGDLTVVFDPNRITRADNIWGRIIMLDINSPEAQTTLYEGGLPLALAVDETGALYASIWGKKGYFRAENDSYSVVNKYHLFWIMFSKMIQVIKCTGGESEIINTNKMMALSNLTCRGKELIGFGLSAEDETGMFFIGETIAPIEQIEKERIKGVLAVTYFKNTLYMSNVEGEIFKYVF
jgi:hypothetical protein